MPRGLRFAWGLALWVLAAAQAFVDGDAVHPTLPRRVLGGAPRHALLLAGAVSQLHGGHYQKAADLYSASNKHVLGAPFKICANTVKKHIIEFNGVPTDVFQHSWNPELEGGFRATYLAPPFNTFVKSYTGVFEDNRPYEAQLRPIYGADPAADWSQVSWSVSMSRAAMMMLQHEQANNITYDRIILVRPDGEHMGACARTHATLLGASSLS